MAWRSTFYIRGQAGLRQLSINIADKVTVIALHQLGAIWDNVGAVVRSRDLMIERLARSGGGLDLRTCPTGSHGLAEVASDSSW